MVTAPGGRNLDDLTRRLAEIDALLDGVAHDPGPEQFALLMERDALREHASRFRIGKDSSRSSTDLRVELENLRRQRKNLLTSRTGYVTGKGGNNHGPTPGAWVKLGAQSLAAGDFGRLDTRIGEILDELKRRENRD